MPPASPAATRDDLITSNSDVLPWSTWPMTVTTGGRSTRSSTSSSVTNPSVRFLVLSPGASSSLSTTTKSYSAATTFTVFLSNTWFMLRVMPFMKSVRTMSLGSTCTMSASSIKLIPSSPTSKISSLSRRPAKIFSSRVSFLIFREFLLISDVRTALRPATRFLMTFFSRKSSSTGASPSSLTSTWKRGLLAPSCCGTSISSTRSGGSGRLRPSSPVRADPPAGKP
mmetsp:Transcript_8821/g.15264  ORF Transcript_8821/g.15264 Transcript_8821/m.15264 type:complete len:226 (-) Transcript_8821:951-1628(-)